MTVGVDEGPVTEWFQANVVGVEPPLTFTLIAGGRSNLTFRVEDEAGQAWAFRRPPTGHVLASAHDVGREHRIISALASHSDVPVPAAIGHCDDPAVNGAPFTVMSFVEGMVLRNAELAAEVDEATRWRAARSAVDVLVTLHSRDPDDLGLGDLGRRDGYLQRQLKRWHGQLQQTKQREIPALDQCHALLVDAAPPQQATAVVHGDYRLDNMVLAPDGPVRAVLDWELCTLGDPLADVAQLAVYWTQPGDPITDLLGAPTAAGGFPTRDQMMGWYAEGSGLDLSALPVYLAFGYWRLACILEGVYCRYLAGAGGGDQTDPSVFEKNVPLLAQSALDQLHQVPGIA